jgi:hypothetical protein
MESDQTNGLSAPAPIGVTAVVAVGATVLAVLTQVFGSGTLSNSVTLALMLSALWGGLFFDWYSRHSHKPKARPRSTQRPSQTPRLSTPHSAFAN